MRIRKKKSLLIGLTMLVLLALLIFGGLKFFGALITDGEEHEVPDASKKTLVFNIDQGFGNGIVVNNDQVGLQRILDAIKPLKTRYRVLVVLNPMVKNKENLQAVLDTLAANDMPFLLDAVSSDVETLGSCTMDTFNAPADPYHGVAASVDELAGYKSKYGDEFAGLRIFEVFGQDFTIRAVKTTDPDWALHCWKIPDGRFFQSSIIEPYLAFAKQNGMFVQWSDAHWYALHSWDGPQAENERQLSDWTAKYPGMVTVTYANNEVGKPDDRIGNWQTAVQSFVDQGAAGYGLSDQSWNCESSDEEDCPASYMIDWALSGLGQGASFVQLEPSWYFFQLPKGIFTSSDYTASPKWENRGYPTESFTALYDALMQNASWPASGNLTATDVTESSATLNWTAASNASYFKVYRDGAELATVNWSTASFQAMDLKPESNRAVRQQRRGRQEAAVGDGSVPEQVGKDNGSIADGVLDQSRLKTGESL
ncbi:hypothetical protein [Cohnella sp. REN36]|uniref:hypothetical protein n=1 Tax=Cohnella sp. REN36 TaxID=2887347 RepID=UPI001D13D27F|nr:hypothetical protein [Cohnella sp. REN36]MCC3373542.1 hypothetical protein [Cohnella sp. REN36]